MAYRGISFLKSEAGFEKVSSAYWRERFSVKFPPVAESAKIVLI